MSRVGIGYDVHALASGRALWLGCVRFDDAERGLSGHSDADVVAHAVCDALLGAAGLGDIGDHFPDTEAKWKDAAGAVLLSQVAAMIRKDGFEIDNVDCVVMSDAVRLDARKKKMEGAMAEALDLSADCVNVKATTFEGHGAVGRGEVIACEAIAMLTG
jgi:2-C-methyl-D-erythritol 2,4-cyclodiphosphate synthase